MLCVFYNMAHCIAFFQPGHLGNQSGIALNDCGYDFLRAFVQVFEALRCGNGCEIYSITVDKESALFYMATVFKQRTSASQESSSLADPESPRASLICCPIYPCLIHSSMPVSSFSILFYFPAPSTFPGLLPTLAQRYRIHYRAPAESADS